MRLPKLLAVLAVASVALAACGSSTTGGTSIKGTIKVGIDLPVSGADASDGQPTQNGAKLAVKLAGKVCGASSHTDACFTLAAFPLDDAVNGVHDVGQGAKNVQQFVADNSVLGMVGPFNSSVAAGEIPIGNAANLAMISPANTNECLTQEPADGHCKGQAAKLRTSTGKNNYFRVCTTDLIQGPAAADYAYNKLGKKKVFVMNDQQQYGLGIAKNFAAQFTKDGGTVLNSDLGGFDPSSQTDFRSLLSRAASLQADVIFFGGTTATKGGQIRKQMSGSDIPYVAGDGISGNQFAKDAGANAANSYFTVAGPYPLKLASAQTFNAAYKTEYGADPGAYSAQAYDAAKIIIAALGKAIDDAGGSMPSREQVRSEVAKTQGYNGAIGTTSFDANGDTTLKIITIYKWTSATDTGGTFVDQVTVS